MKLCQDCPRQPDYAHLVEGPACACAEPPPANPYTPYTWNCSQCAFTFTHFYPQPETYVCGVCLARALLGLKDEASK